MKYSEFKRWLEGQGVQFTKSRGGSSHFKLRFNGKTSVFPFHGSKEMSEELRKKIMKDLGL